MRKLHHDVLLRSVKILNILLMSVPFFLCWFWAYSHQVFSQQFQAGNYLIVVLFLALYFRFGRVYEAFQISTKRIREMIYSQSLSALAADGILFVVIWLLMREFPAVLPMVACFAGQMMIVVVWSYLSNHLYFRVFPPKAAAIIFDVRHGFEKTIQRYGLSKKYDVRLNENVNVCLQNLSLLDSMDTVFLSGIHSRERNIILKYCIARGIQVMVIPRVGDVIMSSASQIHLFHIPMLSIKRYGATPEYLFVKRTFDILLSLLGLIIMSPVMLAVAIAVKAYDGGPVIYSQVRLTKDGREFRIFKYRSMSVNAEADGVARLSTGEKDNRITPVGKVIRKLRLDELPQLVNILKGDLSIVGPRPERPEIAAQYEKEMPEFALRLQAKAGLTGYAQVYGKYNTEPYDKLQMDLMYIAHPSILTDLEIMMATVKILFMPESTEGVEEGQTTAVKEKETV